MIKEGKFGVQEAICLTTIIISAKAFYTSPAAVIRSVGTSGWYMTLISSATALLGFMFIYLLLRRFPGKNLMEIYDIVLGKYIGFIFSFVLFIWILYTNAINLREYIEVLKTYTMPLSPIRFLTGLVMIAIVIFSFLGLEAVARFSRLIAYILLIGYLSVLILSAQNYNIGRLFPVFGYGLKTTVLHGLSRSSAYGEVIFLGIIASSLQGHKHIRRIGIISVILSGLIISSSIATYTLSFPYTVAQETTAPMYVMATLINYGRFFKRLEAIFLFIWNISSLIEITALFYAALMIYCHIFRISDKRPIIIPIAIVFFTLVMMPQGIIDVALVILQSMREWGFILYFFPTIIVLVASLLGKKRGESNNV